MTQDELVITVRETAVANREKDIRLIKARAAQREAIEVTVKADAEKKRSS